MEKKQISLRISKKLWESLNEMAESDFRSINAEIEYILVNAVRNHKTKQDILNEKLIEYLEENDNLQIILKENKKG